MVTSLSGWPSGVRGLPASMAAASIAVGMTVAARAGIEVSGSVTDDTSRGPETNVLFAMVHLYVLFYTSNQSREIREFSFREAPQIMALNSHKFPRGFRELAAFLRCFLAFTGVH